MNFSEALKAIKAGKRVVRNGIFGGGCIHMKKGSIAPENWPDDIQPIPLTDGVPAAFFDLGDDGTATRLPCLCWTTARHVTLEGWVPSQADLFAEDWHELVGEDTIEEAA